MTSNSASWLFLLLKGLILVIIGGLFVIYPLDAAKLFANYIGALLVLGGSIAAYSMYKSSKEFGHKNTSFLLPFISVFSGLLLLYFSKYALLIFALCIGLWVLVDGMSQIKTAKAASKIDLNFGRWLMLFGILSLLIAMVIFINPTGLIAFLTAFFGLILVFSGLFLAIIGLRLKKNNPVKSS